MNGLKLILDAESFDYAFTDRSPLGFRIAISDARDQAAILQESSNVYPGLNFFFIMVGFLSRLFVTSRLGKRIDKRSLLNQDFEKFLRCQIELKFKNHGKKEF